MCGTTVQRCHWPSFPRSYFGQGCHRDTLTSLWHLNLSAFTKGGSVSDHFLSPTGWCVLNGGMSLLKNVRNCSPFGTPCLWTSVLCMGMCVCLSVCVCVCVCVCLTRKPWVSDMLPIFTRMCLESSGTHNVPDSSHFLLHLGVENLLLLHCTSGNNYRGSD